jgi:hypothetical protein
MNKKFVYQVVNNKKVTTRYCKYSQVLLMLSENIFCNM